MKLPLRALALVALSSTSTFAAPPAQEDEAPRVPVSVATREVPPFAFQGSDGRWQGIAIDLWEQVSAELGFTSTYADVSLTEMLEGVTAGEFDVAAAALTVTAEREREMDFSHPFLASGLAITVQASAGASFWSVFGQFLSPAFLQVVAGLGLLLLVCGLLVWLFERRANAEQFGNGVRGIGAGFWWSAVTMTTVGYGDKAPQTIGGRAVGLLWMFTSIIVISSFTAAITSSLTVNRLETAIQGPEDLPGMRVGTVADTTSEAWCQARFLRPSRFPDAEAALDALARKELDAVVYDGPVLSYLVKTEHAGLLTVLPGRVERQDYAFALPEGDERRNAINQVVLEVTASPAWERTLARYLGG